MIVASTQGRATLGVVAFGFGLSAAGDLLAVTALLVHATQGASSQVSRELAVVLLLAVPALASSMSGRPAAAIAGRFRMKTIVLNCTAVEALIYVSLAVLTRSGDLPLVVILPLLAIDAVLTLIRAAAVQAVLPRISDRPVSEVFGIIQAASTTGRLIGPAAGAGLLVVLGVSGALLANAASFAIYALCLITIRVPPVLYSPVVDSGREKSIGYWVLLTGAVGDVVVTVALCIGFVIIVDAALVIYALQVLEAGPAGYAALSTCWAVGILLSSRLPLRDDRRHLSTVVTLASVALGAMLLVDAAVAWLPVAIGSALLAGVAHGLQNRAAATAIAQHYNDHWRAGAFAVFGAIGNGAVAGGLLLSGVLLPIVGARWALALGGTGAILAVAIGSLVRGSVQRRERSQ